ncbi:class I adenylate-forming enzyme family protein [Nocardiopsis sp. NPDC049922]|uniref:class I adenylate-forming enzyme family protein n=1 Tax=Nocardiopsis sp. NPDC049922 TaxID=3155157 RepID=UPI0033F4E641
MTTPHTPAVPVPATAPEPSRFPDLVPARLRERWRSEGHYLGMGVYQLFRTVALAHPDRDAVVDDHGRVSYAALHREVLRVAGALMDLGVRPGEVVAVQLPNQAAAVATELAVAAVGAVALPFPVGRGASEVEALLRGGRAAVLVAATEHRGRSPVRTAETLRSRLPDLRWVVGVDTRGRFLSTTDGPARESDLPAVDASGAARILVSSGSEALPKMVAYSHDALAGGRGNFMASLRRDAEPFRAHFLVPLGSAFGSNATSVVLARHGGTLLLNDHFEAERALATIGEHRPTHVLGVPTMIRMMLDLDRCPRPGDGAVLVLGGAPLEADTARRAREAFGGSVVNLYGSADGVNCHTGLDGDPCDESGPGRPAGRPDSSVVSIRVVDAEGRDVATGATGEIIALGPMTPLCHVGEEGLDGRHRTAEGWVRTGDLGVLDHRGLLRVVGRLKDVVIRGGANISPVEVEAAVRAHPDVADACCFGIPDPLMGERLVAALVPRGGQEPPDVDALAVHLKEGGLDAFKCPERVVRVERLPLTAAGKVDRDALRALVD